MADLFQLTDDTAPYIYTDIRSRTVWDAQTLALPVAYTTDTAQDAADPSYSVPFAQRQAVEVVLTAASAGVREVSFYFVRYGFPCDLPDPTPAANETLIRAETTPEAPILQPDGSTYIHSVRGLYRFALTRPVWGPTDGLPGVSTPASDDTAVDNATDPSQFDPSLL